MSILILILNFIKISENNNVATITGDTDIQRSDVEPKGYSSWTKIIINYGPTGVLENAFGSCSNLEVIHIALSVSTFSSSALYRCAKLKEIHVPEQHPTLFSDEQHALYNADKTELIHCPASLTSFIIPEGVRVIKSYCFNGNYKILHLNIPSSVTTFEFNSFNEMSLQELTYSPNSSQTTLTSEAFRFCYIIKIRIPPCIVKLSSASFYKSNTREIIFDDIENSKLTTIQENCFVEFIGTNITLPPKVKSLPPRCFNSCKNLKYINIPRECESINETAFMGCISLSKLTIDEGNMNFSLVNDAVVSKDETSLFFLPSTMETLTINKELVKISITALQVNTNLRDIEINGSQTFSARDGVLYDFNNETLLSICGGRTEANVMGTVRGIGPAAFIGTKLSEIVFESEDGLDIINEDAFKDCSELTEIRIPRSVTTIKDNCFKGCLKLSRVIFDDECGIKELGTRCFESAGIANITLPRALTRVSYECFFNCKSLRSVALPPNNSLTELDIGSFLDCSNLERVINFTNLKTIATYAFNRCSKLNFAFGSSNRIETIGDSAFYGTGCREIAFGSELQSVGPLAFSECQILERIEFSTDSPIDELGSSSFTKCPLLRFVKLSKMISTIDFSTFGECWELKEMDTDANDYFHFERGILYRKDKEEVKLCLPGVSECSVLSSVHSIAMNSFSGCKKIEKVEFDPNDIIATIGESTFLGCSSLESIVIPDSVTTLGKSIFSGCSSLKAIPLSSKSNLHSLPESCFSGCGFVSVELSNYNSINILHSNCFSGCKNLREVKIGSQITKISAGCFSDCPSIRRVLYCGRKDVCEGNTFDEGVEVFVSSLYEGLKFGTSTVSRVLDPLCSEITIEGITEGRMMFCALPMISDGI